MQALLYSAFCEFSTFCVRLVLVVVVVVKVLLSDSAAVSPHYFLELLHVFSGVDVAVLQLAFEQDVG